MIGDRIPLKTFEVPTGTPVFDWTVPKEWNIRDAYIKGPDGKRVVDFQKCNLHVLNYSTPIHATMPLERTQAASVHDSAESRLDPLPNVLLQGRLGILSVPQSDAGSQGRRVRSVYRLDSRRWALDVR